LTCCICEDRDSTFNYLEGTAKARGICAFCLQAKFHDQLENFKVYVFGRPDVPKHVEEQKSYAIPEGEIRIALEQPNLSVPVAGLHRIVVSTSEKVEDHTFDLHGSLNPMESTCTHKKSAIGR
jgi:hypothetical protein